MTGKSYIDALKNNLEKNSRLDDELPIEEQGKLLMQADFDSNEKGSGRLVYFIRDDSLNNPPKQGEAEKPVRKYVYQAVAQFLIDKAPKQFTFSKISVANPDDVISIATAVTKAVSKSIDGKTYSYSYNDTSYGKITVEIEGISIFGADGRTITYNNGTKTQVATLYSKSDDVQTIMQEYIDDLTKLEKKLIDQTYKEILKELFTKDIGGLIEDEVTARVEASLGKYAERFAQTGAGNVVQIFKNCVDFYKYTKEIVQLSKADPDDIMKAMLPNLRKLEFKPESIRDGAVKKAMKSLNEASNQVEDCIESIAKKDDVGRILSDVYEIVFHFRCPVSIEVYSNTGQQVGYLGEDDIWYDEDYVYVEQYGDEKNVYSHSGDLSFKVSGTDEGVLDCVVEEFEEGESSQRIGYYNIPIFEGKILDVAANGDSITNDGAISIITDGNEISQDDNFTADKYENASVFVSSVIDKPCGGQVEGGGAYVRGDNVVLHAIPSDGYVFSAWRDTEGLFLSSSRTYEFTATHDVEITAEFADYVDVDVDEMGLNDTAIIYDVSSNEDKSVVGSIYCSYDDVFMAFCVYYASSGQMVDLQTTPLKEGQNINLLFDASDATASYAKLMVLNSDYVPQCDAKTIDL